MLIEARQASCLPDILSVARRDRWTASHVPAAGLAGSALAERFCFWRGRSGQRYAFSVFPIGERDQFEADLPRFADAVVILATRTHDGSRKLVSVAATGSLPELTPMVADLLRGRVPAATEVHVHLLAADRAGRESVVGDLAGASAQLLRG